MRGWKYESHRHMLASKGISSPRRYNVSRPFPGVVNLVGYKPTTTQGIVNDIQASRQKRASERDAAADKFLEESQMRSRALSGVGKSPQLSVEEQENMQARIAAISTGQRYSYPKQVKSSEVEEKESDIGFYKTYADVLSPNPQVTFEDGIVNDGRPVDITPDFSTREEKYVDVPDKKIYPVDTSLNLDSISEPWYRKLSDKSPVLIEVIPATKVEKEPFLIINDKPVVVKSRLKQELEVPQDKEFLQGNTRFSRTVPRILRRKAQMRTERV